MRKLFALMPAIALAMAAPSLAQISSQDSRGNTIKTCARDRGDGVLVPCVTPVSPNGAEKATATNPDIIALPANAATEATLAVIRTLLGNAPAQDATLQAIRVLLGNSPAQDTTLQAIKALLTAPALPSNAATAAGQASQLAAQLALQAANGAPSDPACLTTDPTACGQVGLLKGLGSRWDRLLGLHTVAGSAAPFLLGVQGAPGGLPVTTATADAYIAPSPLPATAGQYWDFPVGAGQSTLAPTVTGLTAAAGALAATVSDDRGAHYYPVRFLGTAVLPGATTITADGIYSFAVGGHTNLRLTVSVGGAGNVSVAANASSAIREVSLAGTGTAAANPLFTSPTSLAANASTEGTLAKVATNTKPASSFTAAAVGATLTPGIGIMAVCPSGTSGGSAVFQGADGSQISMPLAAGPNSFPFAVAKVVSQTSATCNFTSLF